MGFLGGLAALSALGFLLPDPVDPSGWTARCDAVRVVVGSCVLGGLGLTMLAGMLLWLAHPQTFLRMRWFRAKAILVATVLPSLHLWGRGRLERFDEAIAAGRTHALPELWHDVAHAFLVAFVIMLVVAALARVKPRLGERYGSRRPSSP